MEAVVFGDGFRLVDASVAFLVATITILEVLVDWGVTLVAVIFNGGCWLVVESADCLVISTAILGVIVNWGVAMVADDRWYGFSFSVIGGFSVCNVTSTPRCAPRELLLWTARQERREISRNPYVKSTKDKTEWKKRLLYLEGRGGGVMVGLWGGEERELLEVLVLSFNFSPFYEVLRPRKNEPVALLFNQRLIGRSWLGTETACARLRRKLSFILSRCVSFHVRRK